MLLIVLQPWRASAHPAVQAGRAQLEQADFQGAIIALQQAEAESDLTRDDVLDLLEVRALAQLGLRDEAAVDRELVRIATLDPAHRFGRDAPPELAEAFARVLASAPGRLALQVDVAARDGHVELTGRVEGDAGALVRVTRVFGRTGTAAPWRSSSNGSLRLIGPPGASAQYYAVAVGPGGASLASAGSAEEPLSTTVPRASSGAAGGAGLPPDEAGTSRGGGTPWAWIIGGGLAAVAVATVLTALAVSSSNSESGTQPSGPVVEGF